MRKKFFLTIILLIIFSILSFVIYKAISFLDNNWTKLEEYKMIPENERLSYKEINYKNNKYILVGFHGNNSTYADNVILLEKKSKYYILEKITNCDISNETAYFKNGSFYIHCIGKKENIIQYELDGINVKKSYLELNYRDVPNISQIHLFVNGIDDKYIYLYSYVKKDDTLSEGKKVKCSLNDKKCVYD